MRLGRALAAGAVTAALVLSGCAAQDEPVPYATATAADLQQSVLHVTEAAGDGEYASARTRPAPRRGSSRELISAQSSLHPRPRGWKWRPPPPTPRGHLSGQRHCP